MKYRKLGRTGFEVSEMAHGLWGMSGWSGSDDRESLEALQLATDLGCNFFDTAWAYGEGKSDGLLGQILSSNSQKRLYAASKIPPMNRRWPARSAYKYQDVFPADHVFQHADMIRKKLRIDSIDLLQFHVWDDSWTDEPEFRSTVEKLKGSGIIRHFGLSLNRWEPENGLKTLRTGLVDAVQVIHNIFDQAPEDKLFPLCQELNIGVIARVPLDEGSLGGKMTLGPDTEYVSELSYRVDADKRAQFASAARRYLPELRAEQLSADYAGIRPKLQGPRDDFRDFVVEDAAAHGLPGLINLIGIESPGVTASAAVAERVQRLSASYF